ncbi:hypothetical protein GOBAR_DD03696 [Gossypium barbadense]|nr:hypothetical protein GOBAR_DD03696 [Gossypium barbadense]
MILYNVARLSIVYTVDDDHISILEPKIAANIAMAFPPRSFIYLPNEDHGNDHFFSPSCPPQLFLGVDQVLVEDESSDDDGSHVGEKKKRLKLEQVKALEKSFESGNKLEPQRKLQLAKALGLKPRQVAIWFQNRRARWKTKQLEKDYDVRRNRNDPLILNEEMQLLYPS